MDAASNVTMQLRRSPASPASHRSPARIVGFNSRTARRERGQACARERWYAGLTNAK